MNLILRLTCVVSLLATNGAACADATIERDLALAREQHAKAIAQANDPIHRRHAATLESLAKRATQAGDLELALKIKEELRSLPLAPKIGGGQNVTVRDGHNGSSGLKNSDNTYSLAVQTAPRKATLRCFMTFQGQANSSFGDILFQAPNGKEVVVGNWSESELRKTDDGARPLEFDVSRHVAGPGTYKVTIQWKKGLAGVRIDAVELAGE
jgi:hypothetical protein